MNQAPATTYYRRTYSGPERTPERIEAAYHAAGLTPPARRSAVDLALAQMPTPEAVAEALAVEALAVEESDAAKWAAQALDRIATANAAEELRRALLKYTARAVQLVAGQQLAAAMADLAPAFEAAVDKLAAAAKLLPADPFDMTAIIDTDATKAARDAGQALTVLASIADVHRFLSSGALNRNVLAILPAVEIPDVPTQDVDRLSGRPLLEADPDQPAREAVRRLFDDAERKGIDRALTELARGSYGEHVTLSLATTRDALAARLRRAEIAITRRRVDSWGYRPTRVVAI